jgi:hypothetical protein
MGCFVIALIIGLSSIFCFFGSVFGYNSTSGVSGEYVKMVPNMFNLAFGSSGTYTSSGYIVQWGQFQGFVFLFAWQIIIMAIFILALIHILHDKNYYSDIEYYKTINVYSAFLITLSLVACITSFYSLNMLGDSFSSSKKYVYLGVGPIIYSIMHISVIIFLLFQIFNNYINRPINYRSKTPIRRPTPTSPYERQTPINSNSNNYSNSINQQNTYSRPVNQSPYQSHVQSQTIQKNKPELSEVEKVDLLIKYKKLLDDGILTQEEFDAKKKDLL